ncbi:Cruciform DNA binding protein [Marasmius tenuissimus]|uniref:Cruciform DNA binding protein n=1 Tax=Marasmius tenuissimus TaxID=585030 RepID=A0ABR3AAM3_9AGAR
MFWSRSTTLSKQDSSFKGTVKVPWNEKIAYKFVVDGQWVVNDREPTERDSAGNLNNVYVAPEKPAQVKAEEQVKAPADGEKITGAPTQESKSDSATSAVSQDPAPVAFSELKQTVVAAEGTSSTLEYLASGVGAAIRGVFGVDPINADKIPVETPKAEVPDNSVEAAGKVDSVADAKQDSLNASPATTQDIAPIANDKTVDDTISEPSQPVGSGVPAPLPVASIEDNTLSTPVKAAAENGPSTHVPASEASVSNGSAAVTPPGLPVTSETESSAPQTTVVSTPAALPPTDVVPPASPPATPAKETTASTVTPTSSAPASRATSPAPSTPTKGKHQRFSSSNSSQGSPKSEKSPSKFKTVSPSRSIRKSLAGLRRVSLKGIFGGKDKEEKEK